MLRVRGRVLPLGRSDAYQRRRGAHVALLVTSWEVTGSRRGGVEGGLDAARARAAAALGAGLAGREAALLRGMVLGQDEAIAEDTRTAFERSGLAHLIAVSGQNVLLLCVLVLGAGALAGLPLRIRLALAIGVVALYVPLAGAGPSIQRAGVMGVAGLVAALAGRPASRWYALGLAAAVTLVINPATAGEPGWQLSFAAVAGLLALAPRLRGALQRRRVPGPVADVLAITTAASLATGPLLAFHFEEVSVVSLPANLVAAPAVPPLMWLGMLAMALGSDHTGARGAAEPPQRPAAGLRRRGGGDRRRAAAGGRPGTAARRRRPRPRLRHAGEPRRRARVGVAHAAPAARARRARSAAGGGGGGCDGGRRG